MRARRTRTYERCARVCYLDVVDTRESWFIVASPGAVPASVRGIVDWDPRRLTARIAFGELAGATARAPVPDAVERRYALRLVKQRLHQAAFRDLVLAAYDHRCAISNLADDQLLDAAHIMAAAHEHLGQPVVANGIASPRSTTPPSTTT